MSYRLSNSTAHIKCSGRARRHAVTVHVRLCCEIVSKHQMLLCHACHTLLSRRWVIRLLTSPLPTHELAPHRLVDRAAWAAPSRAGRLLGNTLGSTLSWIDPSHWFRVGAVAWSASLSWVDPSLPPTHPNGGPVWGGDGGPISGSARFGGEAGVRPHRRSANESQMKNIWRICEEEL